MGLLSANLPVAFVSLGAGLVYFSSVAAPELQAHLRRRYGRQWLLWQQAKTPYFIPGLI